MRSAVDQRRSLLLILPLAWQGAMSRFVLCSYFLFCFIVSPVDASVGTRTFSHRWVVLLGLTETARTTVPAISTVVV